MNVPARSDEMINQEPAVVEAAAGDPGAPSWMRAVMVLPPLAIGAGALLRARGREKVGMGAMAAGIAVGAGAGGLRFLSERRRRQAAAAQERALADERASIETGEL